MVELHASRRISRADAIVEEHKRLHGFVARLESFDWRAAPPSDGVAELAACLHELVPLLEAHFVSEEQGGLFEEIQEAWPNSAHQCAHLRAEHGGLLARFERLRVEAESGTASAHVLADLVARTRAVCRDLARHEDAENELLCRALDDAVAGQD